MQAHRVVLIALLSATLVLKTCDCFFDIKREVKTPDAFTTITITRLDQKHPMFGTSLLIEHHEYSNRNKLSENTVTHTYVLGGIEVRKTRVKEVIHLVPCSVSHESNDAQEDKLLGQNIHLFDCQSLNKLRVVSPQASKQKNVTSELYVKRITVSIIINNTKFRLRLFPLKQNHLREHSKAFLDRRLGYHNIQDSFADNSYHEGFHVQSSLSVEKTNFLFSSGLFYSTFNSTDVPLSNITGLPEWTTLLIKIAKNLHEHDSIVDLKQFRTFSSPLFQPKNSQLGLNSDFNILLRRNSFPYISLEHNVDCIPTSELCKYRGLVTQELGTDPVLTTLVNLSGRLIMLVDFELNQKFHKYANLSSKEHMSMYWNDIKAKVESYSNETWFEKTLTVLNESRDTKDQRIASVSYKSDSLTDDTSVRIDFKKSSLFGSIYNFFAGNSAKATSTLQREKTRTAPPRTDL